MITSFSAGFFNVFRAIATLTTPGIRKYIIVPLIINIALFSMTIYYVSQEFNAWLNSILPTWLDWLNWLIWPLFSIAILVVVFYTFTIIANIIAAPFNSLLSAKYQQILTKAETTATENESLGKLISRTISAEVKKWIYMIKWFIPLLIITVIPFINIVAPFLWIVFAVWMLAIEYLDYPMGNQNHYFPEIKTAAHKHTGLTLGTGIALFILTSTPFLNFIAMPVGVLSATKNYVTRMNKGNQ